MKRRFTRFTSDYYGKRRLTNTGIVVLARLSMNGGSAGHVTLWKDEDGGLWAKHPKHKGSLLGAYRPIGRWRDKKGDFFYFM